MAPTILNVEKFEINESGFFNHNILPTTGVTGITNKNCEVRSNLDSESDAEIELILPRCNTCFSVILFAILTIFLHCCSLQLGHYDLT